MTADDSPASGSVVALCGGVGGAKLADGLHRLLRERLTVIVNTGDDFEHVGLSISPDVDTVIYTLSALADPVRGWGRADETWNFMDTLRDLAQPTWFRLGDRDLAMHVSRTAWLRGGGSLSDFTAQVAHRLGILAQVAPMSDDPVATKVLTPEGELPFQRYFVERRCEPRVTGLHFEGADQARPSPAFMKALHDPGLAAVVICPSNPFLSIDPILAIPGIRTALEQAKVPIVAVSPIIGGKAVKGPATKIMAELGLPTTSSAIAAHYGMLLDGIVIDRVDAAEAPFLPIPSHRTATLMQSADDRIQLARETLAFAGRLAESRLAKNSAASP